jgi:Zn-dependent protease
MAIVPVELQGVSQWGGCATGLLLGMIVQGESQPFYFGLFEDLDRRTRVRYEVNPLRHFDPWSIALLLFAGWGWSSKQLEAPEHVPKTAWHQAFIALSGPIANLLLVGVLSSIFAFLPCTFLEVAITVNVQMALANLLIPLPPMALGRAIGRARGVWGAPLRAYEQAFVVLLSMVVLLEHFQHWVLVRHWITLLSDAVLKYVTHW